MISIFCHTIFLVLPPKCGFCPNYFYCFWWLLMNHINITTFVNGIQRWNPHSIYIWNPSSLCNVTLFPVTWIHNSQMIPFALGSSHIFQLHIFIWNSHKLYGFVLLTIRLCRLSCWTFRDGAIIHIFFNPLNLHTTSTLYTLHVMKSNMDHLKYRLSSFFYAGMIFWLFLPVTHTAEWRDLYICFF